MDVSQILSYLSPLVLASLGWAWRIDNRVTAMASKTDADVAALRVEFQKDLHALELRMAPVGALHALEGRIEKRLDSIDRKLDQVLSKESA